MIRSLLRAPPLEWLLAGCFAAILLFVPGRLESQSWLQYRGSVEGQFAANCPLPAGGSVPSQGKVMFDFLLTGNDAKTRLTSRWFTEPANPRLGLRDDIDAEGNARGSELALIYGFNSRWWGRFSRAPDGSVQASGQIGPQSLDESGCTGTWSAGAAAVAVTETAVCADYRARLESISAEHEKVFFTDPQSARSVGTGKLYMTMNVLEDLREARDRLQEASRRITELKGRIYSDREINVILVTELTMYEDRRRTAYRDIEDLRPRERRHKELLREFVRLQSAASAAGCKGLEKLRTQPGAADELVNALLSLDSSPDSETPRDSQPGIIGVAGVTGTVEVEFQGSKRPLRNGSQIPLDGRVIIRTGPGSSVIIKVGGVEKTLQPNTTLRIGPSGNGQPDFVEQGGTTADVEKPAPYRMQTPTATVEVHGTIFTVRYDATRGVTAVMVQEGRVTVRPTTSAVRPVTLGPGEYVEVERSRMTAVLPAPGATGKLADNPPIRPPVTTGNIDLTGLWRDDTGGGAIYRLRQVGNWVYWIVDGTPMGSYVNASYGQISGNTITGTWVDMPGSPTLSGEGTGWGNLTLRIESNDRLVKVGSGGYGAQVWIRVTSSGGNRQ